MVFLIPLAVLVVVPLMFVGAWYYTNLLRREALEVRPSVPSPSAVVLAVDDTSVLLRDIRGASDGAWALPGIFGLVWEDGYARIGAILERNAHTVHRELVPVQGTLRAGTHVRVDSFAYPHNPREAHGYDYRDIEYISDAGTFPAWLIEGDRDTWIVAVHGKGADRGEPMRVLPTLRARGYPVLIINYRNDEGLSLDPSGFFRYGASEWRDLEAAVEWAVDAGARHVILYGYSMGAGIAMSLMGNSPSARHVAAMVMDSPLLDFAYTVEQRARLAHAPPGMVRVGKVLARLRFAVDWDEVDYLRIAEHLEAPVLLFHGTNDREIHIGQSDRLARLCPDLVTYHRVQGAGHVRSWNVDPEAYEHAVGDFLDRIDGGAPEGARLDEPPGGL